MKKKKLLSVLASVCMAFTMVFGLNGNVFAVGSATQTLTVNGLEEGVTVELYKIIDLNTNEDGSYKDPLFTWTDDVADYVKTNGSNYIDTNNGNEVTQEYIDLTSDIPVNNVPNMSSDITAFIQKMASSVRNNDVKAVQTQTVSKNESSVQFSGLDMGQYLILAKGTTNTKNIYYATVHNVLPNADGKLEETTATIKMKHKVTSLTKDVNDPTVSVGDELTYTLTADIPTYPTNVEDIHYVIGDKLGVGLTFVKDSVVVKIGGKVLTAEKDYTLNQVSTDDATFTVTMKKDTLLANANQQVVVTYKAKVNENAFVEDALGNKAYLEFNSDPFNTNDFSKIPSEKEVYTYNIDITKVNEDGTSNLQGAEFELYGEQSETALKFKKVGNDYILDAENGTTTLTSNEDGKIVIKGLDTGTYTLKETKAPAGGYVKPDGNFTITLVDENLDGKLPDGILDEKSEVNGPNGTISDSSANGLTISFKVKNKKAGDLDLPVTGGTGTLMYTLGGLAVMGGAIYIYLSNKKKHVK